jgi:hypothetical protein
MEALAARIGASPNESQFAVHRGTQGHTGAHEIGSHPRLGVDLYPQCTEVLASTDEGTSEALSLRENAPYVPFHSLLCRCISMISLDLSLCHGRGRGFEPRRPRHISKVQQWRASAPAHRPFRSLHFLVVTVFCGKASTRRIARRANNAL